MFNQVISTKDSSTLLNEYAKTLTKSLLRQRANVAERAARKEAEQSSRLKSDFIATMSHELRTPLNAVLGFSELIANKDERPLTDAQTKEYASLIHTSAGHLLAVINDILDISKIQSGRISLDRAPFPMTELIEKLVAIFIKRAEDAGINLNVRIEPNLPLVTADPSKIRQILINLIDNAIKFTQSPGTVSIACEAFDSRTIKISVIDTGMGMSENDVALALLPFGQVDSSHTRMVEGTGLGLPIANALIKLHSGKLTIASAKNIGTEIQILLPIDSNHSEKAA